MRFSNVLYRYVVRRICTGCLCVVVHEYMFVHGVNNRCFMPMHDPFEEVKLKSNPGQLYKDSIIATNMNDTRTTVMLVKQ